MADVTFSRLTVDSLTVGSPHGPSVFVTPDSLTMHGKRGKPLAKLFGEYDVFSLTLYDHNGQERIRLTIDDQGQPEIAIADGNEQSRVLLTVDHEGHPHIGLCDATGTARLELQLLDEGTPSLAFHDKDETLRFHLLLHDDEASMLAFPQTGEESWHYLLSQWAKKRGA